ncbi:MAG: sigma-70 family RNA polymerase sigma factor [Acidobacteriota bacterium]|nr:sigma-70 family RNA polymerase sigma factor [Acidobacteriota bacterium]
MRLFTKKPADISAKAVDDYGRLVLKVAYRIVPNADQAQEIFQETFLRFHAACTRGEVIAYPKAWLCRVATNVAFNARRRQRAMLGIEEDTAVDSNADRDVERRVLLDRVRDLASELPDRQRTVFALRNFEGCTYAEIAAQLGCSVGAARSSEYKALKKIRAWMATV